MLSFCNGWIWVLETCSEAPLQTDCSEDKYLSLIWISEEASGLSKAVLCLLSCLAILLGLRDVNIFSRLSSCLLSLSKLEVTSMGILAFLSSSVPGSPLWGHSDTGGQSPRCFSESLSLCMRNKKQFLFDLSPLFTPFPLITVRLNFHFSLSLQKKRESKCPQPLKLVDDNLNN